MTSKIDIERIAYRPLEACKATGLCKTGLFEALKSGELKSHKIGRKRLILREDLLAWIGEFS